MAVPAAATTELTDSELAAWKGFLRVHAAMLRQLDSELEAAHELSLSSYEVLRALSCAPHRRLRMADLAGHALLSRSGMTRLVDRLEREGLLRRCSCSDDARGCFAVLSDDGAALVARARATHLAAVRARFLDHLEAGDCERLEALWKRMLAPDAG